MTTTPQFTSTDIIQLLSSEYKLSGNLKTLPGYCDQNLLLTSSDKKQYIVKISNSAEQLLQLEMQNAAMSHLTKKHAAVPHAVENKHGQLLATISNADQVSFYLRVLTFLPGQFYADAAREVHNERLWADLGQFMGKIDSALADFDHAGSYRYSDWDLANSYQVCKTGKQLLDDSQTALVEHFLVLYQNQTLPLLEQLPQGVIHNDANDYNLLVDDINRPEKISGLIDFGDMLHSHVVNELAITCAYALMGQSDPLTTLKTIVAAYHQIKPLQDVELEVLYSLIALRLCTTVCNSISAINESPDNDYLSVSVKPAWQLLHSLQAIEPFAVLCRLRQACHRG